MGKKTKIEITEWSLPVDGPYGSKIAAEIGFEGVQLDVGSYERNFPKTKKIVQDAYLDAAAKYGIERLGIVLASGSYPQEFPCCEDEGLHLFFL